LDARDPIRFAARLHGRDPLVGTVLTVPAVALAELLGERLDFVWIDPEHGGLGTADVQPLAIAARAAGCAAFVRLPSPDWPRLPAILDAGVDGVVVPRVESAADAGHLVERLRHPPLGSRPDDPELLLELAGDVSTLLVCSADVRLYARAVDDAVGRLRAPAREGIGVGA
jgi:2-keto-3-deoxy-L-rhamnonate aldolase RhmA